MAQPDKYLIVSRGDVGDRKQIAFTIEANARKRFAEDKAKGRAVWLYGPVTDPAMNWNRPLLEHTFRIRPSKEN